MSKDNSNKSVDAAIAAAAKKYAEQRKAEPKKYMSEEEVRGVLIQAVDNLLGAKPCLIVSEDENENKRHGAYLVMTGNGSDVVTALANVLVAESYFGVRTLHLLNTIKDSDDPNKSEGVKEFAFNYQMFDLLKQGRKTGSFIPKDED
jgi:hypothetical protein